MLVCGVRRRDIASLTEHAIDYAVRKMMVRIGSFAHPAASAYPHSLPVRAITNGAIAEALYALRCARFSLYIVALFLTVARYSVNGCRRGEWGISFGSVLGHRMVNLVGMGGHLFRMTFVLRCPARCGRKWMWLRTALGERDDAFLTPGFCGERFVIEAAMN
jgi:hypothetical protein